MSLRAIGAAVAFSMAVLAAPAANAVAMYDNLTDWATALGSSYVNTTTDPNSTFTDVNTITLDDGTVLTLGSSANVRQIGVGWGTWSGGYTGIVYYTNGATSFSFSLTPVGALGFEIEPNPFAVYDITLTLEDASVLTQSVDGNAGAKFFGWVGAGITSVTISSDVDFAFGNFFSPGSVPEPATLALIGAGLAGMGVLRRRKAKS